MAVAVYVPESHTYLSGCVYGPMLAREDVCVGVSSCSFTGVDGACVDACLWSFEAMCAAAADRGPRGRPPPHLPPHRRPPPPIPSRPPPGRRTEQSLPQPRGRRPPCHRRCTATAPQAPPPRREGRCRFAPPHRLCAGWWRRRREPGASRRHSPGPRSAQGGLESARRAGGRLTSTEQGQTLAPPLCNTTASAAGCAGLPPSARRRSLC